MRLEELRPSDEAEDEADEEYGEYLEDDLSTAVDLLETCRKVLKRIIGKDRRYRTKYNENLVADITFFIDALDLEDNEG